MANLGAPLNPDYIVPGTGQSVSELEASGYSAADVQSLMGNTSPDTGVSIADNSQTSGSGFGGALDDLFSALPQLATSIGQIVTGPPKPGQLVYNPATGTWQPAGAMTTRQTAAVGGTLANPLVLIAIAVVAILLLRK